MMAAAPIGMLIQKIARQLTSLTSRPPITGPRARLIPNTAPHTPMARARARRSVNVLLTMDRATGLSIDPPRACTPRKTTSAVTLQARLHSSDPSVNTTSPIWNTRRRPNRSAIDPEAISRLPMTSVYASTDHCRPLREACSPRRIAGSATLTMVESVPTISRLMQQMARISHGRRRLAFMPEAPARHRRLLTFIYLLYTCKVGGRPFRRSPESRARPLPGVRRSRLAR